MQGGGKWKIILFKNSYYHNQRRKCPTQQKQPFHLLQEGKVLYGASSFGIQTAMVEDYKILPKTDYLIKNMAKNKNKNKNKFIEKFLNKGLVKNISIKLGVLLAFGVIESNFKLLKNYFGLDYTYITEKVSTLDKKIEDNKTEDKLNFGYINMIDKRVIVLETNQKNTNKTLEQINLNVGRVLDILLTDKVKRR